MSAEDNKQLVMRGYERFGNRDFLGVVNMCTDEVEWTGDDLEYVPFSGSFRGKAGVADFFTKMGQSIEMQDFRPQLFVAEGDNVVVSGTSRAAVKATGITYDDRWVHIFTVRNGELSRMEQHHDTAAIQAAFKPAISPSTNDAEARLPH